jgi:phosphoribosyl-AMP cyclohydrolase
MSPPETVGFFVIGTNFMELDFSKLDGLVAAVIQDWKSGRVLMVGFMNEESFRKTVETGNAVFYSRSRNKLWLKGETSGHKLVVKEISTDCDRDAVLLKVEALVQACATKATRAASSASSMATNGRSPRRARSILAPYTETK